MKPIKPERNRHKKDAFEANKAFYLSKQKAR